MNENSHNYAAYRKRKRADCPRTTEIHAAAPAFNIKAERYAKWIEQRAARYEQSICAHYRNAAGWEQTHGQHKQRREYRCNAYAAKQNALLALVNKPGNERLRYKSDNIADSKYYADLIVGITFKLQKYGRKAKQNSTRYPV